MILVLPLQSYLRSFHYSTKVGEPHAKVAALAELGAELAKVERWDQANEIWLRAEEIAQTITKQNEKGEALIKLGITMVSVQQWERAKSVWMQAKKVVDVVEDGVDRAILLIMLGKELNNILEPGQAKLLWFEAETIAFSLEKMEKKEEMLMKVAETLVAVREHEQLLCLVQRSWRRADTRESAIRLLPLANGLIHLKPSAGIIFCKAFDWVDTFLES